MSNEIRYYEDGTQATAANLNKPLQDLNKQGQYISKVEFESLAEMRRNAYAGSGYVSVGSYRNLSYYTNINDGLFARKSNDLTGYNNSLVLRDNRISSNTVTNEPAVYNVNGDMIKIKGMPLLSSVYESIKLPQAPTSLGIITEDMISFEMKQGDFAILNDINTNHMKNDLTDSLGDWYARNAYGTISYDSDTKIANIEFSEGEHSVGIFENRKDINILKGIEYEISFDLIRGDINYVTFRLGDKLSENVYAGSMEIEGTKHTFRKIHTSAKDRILIVANYDDNNIQVTNISVKQVKTQPVVALRDKETNSDLINLEARASISRQDLMFLETWHEDVSEKDIVYPFGNVQYQGGNTDSLSGITEGTFSGADTYSLFGNWQEANDLMGKGYIWSNLSNEDKLKFSGNKENNIYNSKDGLIQVRYRIRVIKGLNNDWINLRRYIGGNDTINSTVVPKGKLTFNDDYNKTGISASFWITEYESVNLTKTNTISSKGTFIERHDGFYNKNSSYGDTSTQAIPIALVQRRNDGAFDPVHNPEGSGTFSDDKKWYETSDSHNSLVDCFNNKANGSIESEKSGRPEGLFYDEINKVDIEDVRMNALKIDNKTFLNEIFNKSISGDIKGKENNINIKWVTFALSSSASENNNSNGVYIWNIETNKRQYLNKLNLLIKNGKNINRNFRQHLIEWIDASNNSLGFELITETNYTDQLISEKPTDAVAFRVAIYQNSCSYTDTYEQCDIIGNPNNYPQQWKDNGISGIPLLIGENEESLLPVDKISIKLSRKSTYDRLVLFKHKNGTFIEGKYNGVNGDGTGIGFLGGTWSSSNNRDFTIGFNAYDDLGYDSIDEMKEKTIILFYYRTNANNMLVSDNKEIIDINKEAIMLDYHDTRWSSIVPNLINKVPTSTSGYSAGKSMERYKFIKFTLDNETNKLPVNYGEQNPNHNLIERINKSSPAVKVFPYLTSNGKGFSEMNIVFKEIKWDLDADELSEFPLMEAASPETPEKGLRWLIEDVSDFGLIAGKYIVATKKGSDWSTGTWALLVEDDNGNWVHPNGHIYAKNWHGNGLGDDGQFQIINGISIIDDDNGQKVLYGQKSIKLNRFIED